MERERPEVRFSVFDRACGPEKLRTCCYLLFDGGAAGGGREEHFAGAVVAAFSCSGDGKEGKYRAVGVGIWECCGVAYTTTTLIFSSSLAQSNASRKSWYCCNVKAFEILGWL